MFRHILVPIDGTELSTDTVGRAVEFAATLGAQLSFFHASPGYDRFEGSACGPGQTLTPRAYAERSSAYAQELLMKAEAAARLAGVACRSLHQPSDDPHAAITDIARRLECDLIVMAAHARHGLRGLLGSQTQKVLANSEIPVLVITTARSEDKLNKAIAIIQDEHRSLAVVVRGLLFLVNAMRTEGRLPQYDLLRRMLRYIEEFPEALHHPKEELYLFNKLQARTQAMDEVIADLRRQHVEGHQLVAEMKLGLEACIADPAKGLAAFSLATERFARAQWEHMSLEENVLRPAARAHLSDEDWREITVAFGANGDSRFAADVKDEFHEQFAMIYRYPAWRQH